MTTGSFGFEIELAPDTVPEGRLRPEVSISERAVAMIQDLLQGALDASDDDLAELAGSLHPRAVNKIAEFVRILNNSGAQVSLGLNDRKVALRTPQDVDRANSRLAPRNIVETTSARTGTLIGMVPSRRTFELRERDTGVPIQGRIGHELEAPYRMAATYTNRDVIASIRQVRAGRSQPQYTLLEIVGLANPNERL